MCTFRRRPTERSDLHRHHSFRSIDVNGDAAPGVVPLSETFPEIRAERGSVKNPKFRSLCAGRQFNRLHVTVVICCSVEGFSTRTLRVPGTTAEMLSPLAAADGAGLAGVEHAVLVRIDKDAIPRKRQTAEAGVQHHLAPELSRHDVARGRSPRRSAHSCCRAGRVARLDLRRDELLIRGKLLDAEKDRSSATPLSE